MASPLLGPQDIPSVMQELRDRVTILEQVGTLPVGICAHCAGAVPDGWLLEDGSTLNAARYGQLVAYLGSTTLPSSSYTEFTADVTLSAATEATANTIITAPALVADGVTPYWIEYGSVISLGANGAVNLWLYDGASSRDWLTQVYAGASGAGGLWPCSVKRRIVPTAGSHTYSVRGSNQFASGSAVGRSGGAGTFIPGYLRVYPEQKAIIKH